MHGDVPQVGFEPMQEKNVVLPPHKCSRVPAEQKLISVKTFEESRIDTLFITEGEVFTLHIGPKYNHRHTKGSLT